MRAEIGTAVQFIVSKLMATQMPPECVDAFRAGLCSRLEMKYTGHWHPEAPLRGNGYRAITCEGGKPDQIVCDVLYDAGVPAEHVHAIFPADFAIWVDPGSVDVRIGHDGSVWGLELLHEGHFVGFEPYRNTQHMATTPVKSHNPMAITPMGKQRPRHGHDSTLTDISNVLAAW